jgi:hypothetical protein
MEPTNLTIEILKSIRDEVKGVRTEMHEGLSALQAEVRVTNERVDALREQQIRTELRLATELVATTSEFRGLRDDLRKNGGFFGARLDDHEARIGALEKRAGRRP